MESWKLKVVLVGAVKAGKTSLANGIIKGKPQLCHEDDRTKGVDVHVGEPCKIVATRKLEFVFWDFAGHPEYYSTHQLFLSKGALHLLVVDLKRFGDEPLARGELVDVWLDALKCRVPGSNVLVVATQIDRCTGDTEAILGALDRTVKSHLSAEHNAFEGKRRNAFTSLDAEQSLTFHGVVAVSSACSQSLMNLRFQLYELVHSKRGMFPHVGQRRPLSWARVAAMLDAKRLGKDPVMLASLVGAVDQDQGNVGTTSTRYQFLRRADAINEWYQVVRTLERKERVESGMFKSCCAKTVFEVRGEQNIVIYGLFIVGCALLLPTRQYLAVLYGILYRTALQWLK